MDVAGGDRSQHRAAERRARGEVRGIGRRVSGVAVEGRNVGGRRVHAALEDHRRRVGRISGQSAGQQFIHFRYRPTPHSSISDGPRVDF